MSKALDFTSLGIASEDIWNGFRRLNFMIQGRRSCLVLPDSPRPDHPWIWRPTFLDAWPNADIALIGKGFYLGYTEVLDWYGAPEGVRHGAHFHRLLTACGLNRRFAFVALSCGGVYAFRYAARYPGQVACIYADAPVCDLRSWPGGRGRGEFARNEWEQVLRANRVTEEEALADSFQPTSELEPLVKAGVPLFHICGGSDDIVPIDENSEVLAARYSALGGSFQMIVKPGVGHHPHGLENPSPIVEFVERHSMADGQR